MTETQEALNIVVTGAAGRMGQMLITQIIETPGAQLSGATESPSSPHIGQDPIALAGALTGSSIEAKSQHEGDAALLIEADPAPSFAKAGAIIDFTAPSATVTHAKLAAQAGAGIVIGTTGMTAEDEAALDLAARHVPVVYAANYSPGVTLLTDLVQRAAAALGDDYDIDILEMHHRHKVDAPSGTAYALGKAAAEGRGVTHEAVAQTIRSGQTGARPRGEIGYATLRGGDVVGEHDAIFAAEGERLILGHRASSRRVFAAGAVRAALWTKGARPGLYNMKDVLGLRD